MPCSPRPPPSASQPAPATTVPPQCTTVRSRSPHGDPPAHTCMGLGTRTTHAPHPHVRAESPAAHACLLTASPPTCSQGHHHLCQRTSLPALPHATHATLAWAGSGGEQADACAGAQGLMQQGAWPGCPSAGWDAAPAGGGRGCVGARRQQEGSLRRTIEGNGGTGKRPSGSTVSTDGLVRSSMIHGKKALSAPQRACRSVPNMTLCNDERQQ